MTRRLYGDSSYGRQDLNELFWDENTIYAARIKFCEPKEGDI